MKQNHRDYYDLHVKVQGGREIVQLYGEREGDEYDSEKAGQQVIFTYVDSEILNVVDIYDTPGSSAGEDAESELDELIAQDMRNNSDAVIYLMPANQFLHRQDFQLLKRDIELLPKLFDDKNGLAKLPNLFVTASQGDIIDSPSDIKKILTNGAKRFSNTLSAQFFESMNCTPADLAKRFFAISSKPGREDVSEAFEADFDKFLERSQKIILDGSLQERLRLVTAAISEADEKISISTSNKENHEDLVKRAKELEKTLPSLLKGNEQYLKRMKSDLADLRRNEKSNFTVRYNHIMSEENILDLINVMELKNKKADRELLVNKISNQLSDAYKAITTNVGKDLEKMMADASAYVQLQTNVSTSIFDYKLAGLGLVASGVTAGAFAVVAAGISSNLGLYIVVAQVGGYLTSLGILSSPIVATSTVAALGGPVTWVIGLSLAVGIAVYGLFNRNAWKSKLASAIVKDSVKNDTLSKYLKELDKYFDATVVGAENIKLGLDVAAKGDVELSKSLVNADDADFDKEIVQLESFKTVINQIN